MSAVQVLGEGRPPLNANPAWPSMNKRKASSNGAAMRKLQVRDANKNQRFRLSGLPALLAKRDTHLHRKRTAQSNN